MEFTASLSFGKGYIAHPYWPSMERLINIQKESGVNRVRSVARRESALREYLESHGLTMDDYLNLENQSMRPFYTIADVLAQSQMDGLNPNEIVVPAHHMYGCLAQAADMATSSIRIAVAEQLRSVLTIGDFRTARDQADGIWERYVVVKSGAGTTLSNQRAMRRNAYISNFTATGSVAFSGDILPDAEKVRKFIEFAGREIGIGASRKLGWGRFIVSRWTETT